MRFAGTVAIAATPADVWAALTDPATLSAITPGVQAMDVVVPDQLFRLRMQVPMGPQFMMVPATVEWVEIRPNQHLSICAAAEFKQQQVSAEGELDLAAVGDGSEITFKATVHAQGLPQPFVHSVANSMIRTIFTNLKQQLEHTQPHTLGTP